MRTLLLAGFLALLPLPASALLDYWTCAPARSLFCRPGQGCESVPPRIDHAEVMPIAGRLSVCRGEGAKRA